MGRPFCISSRQYDIIVGTLFGDGRLECRSKRCTARLRVHHCAKQKALVFWKYKKLRNLVSTGPRRIHSWVNPRNKKKHYSWYFHTKTFADLGLLYNMFYINGKKRLPEKTENILNPLMLAVWYMDDGSRDRQNIILNTQNFEYFEQEKLQKIFRQKYKMKTYIVKDRDKFRLYFDKRSSEEFLSVIKDEIISSFRYKLVPVTTEPKGEASYNK